MSGKCEKNAIFPKGTPDPVLWLRIFIHKNRPRQIYGCFIGFSFLILVMSFRPAFCQYYYYSNPPITYYYTNPLFFTDFGYINSITEPFYYLGYGYKPPIEGNTLLAWNRYTPFNDPYSTYLLNFLEIPTYAFFGSPYQTTFPYRTLPGTDYPYARFQYPAYTYGAISAYQLWVMMQ